MKVEFEPIFHFPQVSLHLFQSCQVYTAEDLTLWIAKYLSLCLGPPKAPEVTRHQDLHPLHPMRREFMKLHHLPLTGINIQQKKPILDHQDHPELRKLPIHLLAEHPPKEPAEVKPRVLPTPLMFSHHQVQVL